MKGWTIQYKWGVAKQNQWSAKGLHHNHPPTTTPSPTPNNTNTTTTQQHHHHQHHHHHPTTTPPTTPSPTTTTKNNNTITCLLQSFHLLPYSTKKLLCTISTILCSYRNLSRQRIFCPYCYLQSEPFLSSKWVVCMTSNGAENSGCERAPILFLWCWKFGESCGAAAQHHEYMTCKWQRIMLICYTEKIMYKKTRGCCVKLFPNDKYLILFRSNVSYTSHRIRQGSKMVMTF